MSGDKTFDDGIRAAFDLVSVAAANTRDDAFSDRLYDLAEDILEEAPEVKAKWKELSVQLEKLRIAKEALEKLARLGNGREYGNSDGNLIARAALRTINHE